MEDGLNAVLEDSFTDISNAGTFYLCYSFILVLMSLIKQQNKAATES
jgi:hypothetical protein